MKPIHLLLLLLIMPVASWAGQADKPSLTDDELLDLIQTRSFTYFWDHADPETGMAFERIPSDVGPNVTTGGTGFGIQAIVTAAHRGWITREQASARIAKIVGFLARVERFKGAWAHWYRDGVPQAFSAYDDGGDLVETAFLIQGLLVARQYFDQDTPLEESLRGQITELWETVDWAWYRRGQNKLFWHWSKNHGWKMNMPITGYNEALIVYILAAASPTNTIDAAVYHQGWANPDNANFKNGRDYYGYRLPLGPHEDMGGPLFFAHYSFMALDPRGLSDRYADYWLQARNQVLISKAYSTDNPKGYSGYGSDFWGLTAGDDVPNGYAAHAPGRLDVGTLNPTGPLASMPYDPAGAKAVLRNLYETYGDTLLGPMGFYDAINPSVEDGAAAVRQSYLAIDQGPIVVMIENYRSGLHWRLFMQDPDVRRGLSKLGFKIDGGDISPESRKPVEE